MPFLSVSSLVGIVKALHALNGNTWHEIFLGLWMAALRLVQRVWILISLVYNNIIILFFIMKTQNY